MSQPFIGEVRLFGGNFAPIGWAFCEGQLLPINEYVALFSLIGTTYGGDGMNYFALPDLRGRVPVHQGGPQGYVMGETGGVETVTLGPAQMPAHTHAMLASTTAASTAHGVAEVLGTSTAMKFYGAGAPNMAMDANALTQVGGQQAHDNMPPFVGLSFIMALFGIFPSQN
jgi:microcystin-dependent protein